jgi:hypothetical protein
VDSPIGILDKNEWDVFCSYSRLDNDLHHDWIKIFAADLMDGSKYC